MNGAILQIIIMALALVFYYATPLFVATSREKIWLGVIVLILQSVVLVSVLMYYFHGLLG